MRILALTLALAGFAAAQYCTGNTNLYAECGFGHLCCAG